MIRFKFLRWKWGIVESSAISEPLTLIKNERFFRAGNEKGAHSYQNNCFQQIILSRISL